MLTCKKLEQKAVFDTDKLLNVVFHTNMKYNITSDNFVNFKHNLCKLAM